MHTRALATLKAQSTKAAMKKAASRAAPADKEAAAADKEEAAAGGKGLRGGAAVGAAAGGGSSGNGSAVGLQQLASSAAVDELVMDGRGEQGTVIPVEVSWLELAAQFKVSVSDDRVI
jgi:hypothetical protein